MAIVEILDKESKKKFDSMEEYAEWVSKEGFFRHRWYQETTFERKDKKFITGISDGIIDCGAIAYMNLLLERELEQEFMELEDDYDVEDDEDDTEEGAEVPM